MILHDFSLSSACYRVRIVLSLKGLSYEKRNHMLRTGEQRAPDYLEINPAGLVPALEVDGIRLGQSLNRDPPRVGIVSRWHVGYWR